MRLLKKQKGYVLILVLVIIVIIGIFTPVIISNLLSSNLQFRSTEKNIKLENLQIMSITYVEKAIDESAKEAQKKVNEWVGKQTTTPIENQVIKEFFSLFEIELKMFIPKGEIIVKMMDSNQQFKVVISAIETPSISHSIVVKYKVESSLDKKKLVNSSINGEKNIEIKFGETK